MFKKVHLIDDGDEMHSGFLFRDGLNWDYAFEKKL